MKKLITIILFFIALISTAQDVIGFSNYESYKDEVKIDEGKLKYVLVITDDEFFVNFLNKSERFIYGEYEEEIVLDNETFNVRTIKSQYNTKALLFVRADKKLVMIVDKTMKTLILFNK